MKVRGTVWPADLPCSHSQHCRPAVSRPFNWSCPLCAAVLGRFLHSLNQFCREAYGMDFNVCDYHVYDFAKVGHALVAALQQRHPVAPVILTNHCSRSNSARLRGLRHCVTGVPHVIAGLAVLSG